jgi:hypothetical protein
LRCHVGVLVSVVVKQIDSLTLFDCHCRVS